MQVAGFAVIRLDISDFPTRHPYGLGLRQNHIERILAGWVERAGGADPPAPRSPASRRTTPASTSSCPTASRCGRSISSAATADAAWSARQPASSSPAGIRRRAA